MKIIFSRKGFDSGNGGFPSPILPDGTMLSFPIQEVGGVPLGGLQGRPSLAELATDLTAGVIDARTPVHLDPDLRKSTLVRASGWWPAFGQDGSAQGHLVNQGVGAGDLFLYFGWFRHVVRDRGRWTYDQKQHGHHSLFGWLQVEEVLCVDQTGASLVARFPWLADHPHIVHAANYRGNTIYLSRSKLHIGPQAVDVPGAGCFTKWQQELRLSVIGPTRSIWRVPQWMMPGPGRKPLSFHKNPKRWRTLEGQTLLESVSRGQEFVLDCEDYPQAVAWAKQLIEAHAG